MLFTLYDNQDCIIEYVCLCIDATDLSSLSDERWVTAIGKSKISVKDEIHHASKAFGSSGSNPICIYLYKRNNRYNHSYMLEEILSSERRASIEKMAATSYVYTTGDCFGGRAGATAAVAPPATPSSWRTLIGGTAGQILGSSNRGANYDWRPLSEIRVAPNQPVQTPLEPLPALEPLLPLPPLEPLQPLEPLPLPSLEMTPSFNPPTEPDDWFRVVQYSAPVQTTRVFVDGTEIRNNASTAGTGLQPLSTIRYSDDEIDSFFNGE